ncbi:MAG: 23S rRNA (guanosine(2251)-2'-O)-methyltransferase RlmB [Bacteroidales bacterium]|nr:23S rRNA (guanosine(2251)-2'-O)-methyltransferase RlmB [Bacteroidales bacterium]
MKSQSEIIFGLHPIMEAIKSGKELEKVYLKTGLKGPLSSELIQMLGQARTPYQWVPVERLNRFTRKNHQGAVALLSLIEFKDIEEIVTATFEAGKNPFIVVLDEVTDIRNFGAIARTAECAGADAIVIPEKGAAQINADAIKTSAGALHHIPVCRVKNINQTIRFFKNSGLRVYAATEKASEDYYFADYTVPLALVMGAEDRGISDEILNIADTLVKIPVKGAVNSLNVSVAAGVFIFEILRQRNKL